MTVILYQVCKVSMQDVQKKQNVAPRKSQVHEVLTGASNGTPRRRKMRHRNPWGRENN